MKNIKKLFKTEVEGIGVVEIILILLVLILLIVLFREQISGIVTRVFNNINNQVDILNTTPSPAP
ncbi:MAG: multidrug transporter [Clostridiales bacterium]|nr:multidrug transporter [Clostridiales bacterium]